MLFSCNFKLATTSSLLLQNCPDSLVPQIATGASTNLLLKSLWIDAIQTL